MHSVKDLVMTPGNRCVFDRFVDRSLWYTVVFQDGRASFEFPVPVKDVEGAIFLREDTPKFFMRWIRKQVEFLAEREKTGLPKVGFVRFADGKLWYRRPNGMEFPVEPPCDEGVFFKETEFEACFLGDIRAEEKRIEHAKEQAAAISSVVGKKWARAQVGDAYGPVVGYDDGYEGTGLNYHVRCEDTIVRPYPVGSLTLLEPPTCTNMVGFVACGECCPVLGGVYCSDACMNRGK